MMPFIKAYVAAALCLLALDAIWLTTMASRLYQPALGQLLAPTVSIVPAILFYVLYLIGVTCLAALPAHSWRNALGKGTLLGLVAYGTYDFTNQATLKDWPTLITACDLAWGTFLTASATLAGYAAAGRNR